MNECGWAASVKFEVTVLRLVWWCEAPFLQDTTAETSQCLCHRPAAVTARVA